jgi:hypothetical protein
VQLDAPLVPDAALFSLDARQGLRRVGILASRTRRDRDPAQQPAAQDAWVRDTRRGVLRAGGQATNAVTSRNAVGVRYGT